MGSPAPFVLTSIQSKVPQDLLVALRNLTTFVNALQARLASDEAARLQLAQTLAQTRADLASLTSIVNAMNRRVTALE